ncbi:MULTISPECIES: xanthine dehydrogenase accessory protein XdhC [unclassified Pseudactinotalea]|uniref:xanthine dehydrogenase accessory protein XdhC n=1 Tax=unclassified Pseudactinotalea TaxID=2649176 RepID=UPI00128E4602|nr:MULTISPECIES: xanthine dehydrogenase accessory protein XdhC [unclassified Pseudactinotalea]MPV48705.1 xanthine dehydrogenase accessory protein XdhC [Pseudactinotalea sp. HY160]QGH68670.1 xanthine dehydrogenase accessory protein XdhC [Pseudactinotalea sp. HY158]
MDWITALSRARHDGTPGVLATIVEVRGHSPRNAGAKMFVAADSAGGSIGGGNMEATVTERARAMITAGVREIEHAEFGLNEHAHVTYGTQCCGGIVRVLLEPIGARPTVAVFGLGHVGGELARILARHDLILHLTDSRAAMIDDELVRATEDCPATVHRHTLPAPETLLADLPDGAHLLVLTHDHAEDLALCDAALRRGGLGSIGVIGSAAKWSRFRMKLAAEGHTESAIERIHCPIGVPDIAGKAPAVIAVSVAADLMRVFQKAAA